MRKLGNFLYYFFFASIGMITIFMVLFSLVYGDGSETMPMILMGMAVLMIVVTKLLTHKDRKLLRIGSGRVPIWKPSNLLSSFLLYNLLLIADAVYLFLAASDISGTAAGADTVSRAISILILTAGTLYIWILHCNIMLAGVGNYLRALWRFVSTVVWIYLLYRLAVFVFTLSASTVMLLIDDDGDSLITRGYFMYILEDSLDDNLATGFLSQQGNFMSGLTAASSYFVLSSMALESFQETGEVPLKTRVKRLFLDKDTFRLLLMTVLCVIVPLIPDEVKEQTAVKVMYFVMSLSWLLSFISFLKETQIIPYLINYITLTFVETLIPVPEMSGIGLFFISAGAIVLRILLFAALAVMIAYFQNMQMPDGESEENNPTVLGAGRKIANLYFNRKEIRKNGLAEAMQKIRGRIAKE